MVEPGLPTALKTGDDKVQALLMSRQYGPAEQLIRERLRKEPDSSDAFYLLGVFLLPARAAGSDG